MVKIDQLDFVKAKLLSQEIFLARFVEIRKEHDVAPTIDGVANGRPVGQLGRR